MKKKQKKLTFHKKRKKYVAKKNEYDSKRERKKTKVMLKRKVRKAIYMFLTKKQRKKCTREYDAKKERNL